MAVRQGLVYPVKSHFLDSGAFSLRRASRGAVDYRAYMDRYAAFIKENEAAIDYYANVDVIGDPQRTWEHQQYLEGEHGLRPVPVLHFGTDVKWADRYLSAGHRFVALGGLVGRTAVARPWLRRAFAALAGVRVHGFGIINYRLLVRHPWWSVDSAAWVKEAEQWGAIFVPHRRGGQFVFGEDPYKILTAATALKAKGLRHNGHVIHYHTIGPREREVVRAWLEEIKVPLGGEGPGVLTCRHVRSLANLRFFERLRRALPHRPRIYYSGSGRPETLLGPRARVMMTFYEMPCKRFRQLLKARRTGRPVGVNDDGE